MALLYAVVFFESTVPARESAGLLVRAPRQPGEVGKGSLVLPVSTAQWQAVVSRQCGSTPLHASCRLAVVVCEPPATPWPTAPRALMGEGMGRRHAEHMAHTLLGALRIPLGMRLWCKDGPSKYALALELPSYARNCLRCHPEYSCLMRGIPQNASSLPAHCSKITLAIQSPSIRLFSLACDYKYSYNDI